MPWSSSARSQRRLVAPRGLRSICARSVGIGRVDADVQRRQALGDDPLEVGLGEAGERREVPVQEAQPVVVVLQVQAAAQALGQLVDEAELAVVVARADPVEQGAGHLGAERLAGPLDDVELEVEAAAGDLQADDRLVGPQPPLDDVARHPAVDARHGVTGPEPGDVGRRTGRDRDDERRVHRPSLNGLRGRGTR